MKQLLCQHCNLNGMKTLIPFDDTPIISKRFGCTFHTLPMEVFTFKCPKCGKDAQSYAWGNDD